MFSKRSLLCAMLAGLMLTGISAQAAKLVNVVGSPIPGGLSDAQIVTAIQAGGKTRGWVVKKLARGHLEATLFVRSHIAKVDINYDGEQYSITYKDSTNLKYKDGKIHRNYNSWVKNLDTDIQREMAMIEAGQ